MFKRFLVSDLYHKREKYGGGEWKDCSKELPLSSAGIFKVKLENGSQCLAYYYEDKIMQLVRYTTMSSSYWWDLNTKEPLHNVIEWEENLDEN